MMIAGMYAAPFKLGWSNFMRLMGTMDVLEKPHKEQPPRTTGTCMVSASIRRGRARAIGSALMQPVLAKADAAHLAVLPRDAEGDQRQALPQARLRRGRRG